MKVSRKLKFVSNQTEIEGTLCECIITFCTVDSNVCSLTVQKNPLLCLRDNTHNVLRF